MSDELAAFFAKKTKGKKKKGVIELKEISEQLERKAMMEQRDEGEDAENKPVDEGNNAKSRPSDNNEDSEWLDFDDSANITVAIKEMTDGDAEQDEVEKRASAEPTRTWNLTSQKSEDSDDTPPVVVKKETKYMPPTMKRDKAGPLDLSSEEMFPSIEKAPEVEQKLKAMDEEKRRQEVEDRKRKEKQEEEERARREKMYKAPKGGPAGLGEGNSPRRQQQMDGEGRKAAAAERESTEPAESESTDDWRSMQKPMKPAEEEKKWTHKGPREGAEGGNSPRRQMDGEGRKGPAEREPTEPAESEKADDWRRKPVKPAEEESPRRTMDGSRKQPEEREPAEPAESDTTDNWRTVQRTSKPAAEEKPIHSVKSPERNQPEAQKTDASAPPKTKTYVPPHLRPKN